MNHASRVTSNDYKPNSSFPSLGIELSFVLTSTCIFDLLEQKGHFKYNPTAILGYSMWA